MIRRPRAVKEAYNLTMAALCLLAVAGIYLAAAGL